MLNGSNRRRPKASPRIDAPYEGKNRLEFAYSASREYTNFGFGSYKSDGITSFVSTEDIRVALDRAFQRGDSKEIRVLSRHFFRVSGIYSSAVQYLAYLPTYDYLIIPRVLGTDVAEDKVSREVVRQLFFLEKMGLKQSLKDIALDVIVDGVSYVYFRRKGGQGVIQKLPIEWCRTTGMLNGRPVVEFNLDYLELAGQESEKVRRMNSLPPEIVYEYNIWKEDSHKMKNSSHRRRNSEYSSTLGGTWITLSPENSTAFYFHANKQPILANSFFAILDVMELKGIEKKKAENELYNLVVQKFGFLEDGEPILELPDMQAFHNSAKKIFEKTNQTDLLTTLADIENINLNEAAAAPIDFAPWNKSVYSELGISSQLFSTEGNMALEKSMIVDESLIFTLVEKFENWINSILDNEFLDDDIEMFSTRLTIPPISNNNRQEMSQKYKDMATLGYGRLLPAIALGQSQLDIMATPVFENSILDLDKVMKPLQSSHTASGKSEGGGANGRPPLPDSKKSEKTIQNGGG